MTILDRYLTWLFIKTLTVCFVSFAGLFVVVHLFSNLDELTAISGQIGWWGVFQEFYLPRFADLFDKSAGIVILVSALFTISLLQRRQELSAMEASGIHKGRILRGVLVVSAILIVVTIANREWVIPQFKTRLVQTPQSWGSSGEIEMTVQTDPKSGVVLRGETLRIGESKILPVTVQLPYELANRLPSVSAKWGILEPENDQHPPGIWLHEVDELADVERVGTLENADGDTVLYTAASHSWIGPGQCFIRCDFDPQQIAYGDQMTNYLSTGEMIANLRQPQRWSVRTKQVAIHARLVKPVLEMALLLLGLPVVIGGVERNVFVSAGICFWVIAGMQLVTMTCYFLGSSNLIQPPALAAWLPAIVFVPLASVAARQLRR